MSTLDHDMHDNSMHEDNTLDANLRLQLRGLRRDVEPGVDLWPAIAARLRDDRAGTVPAPRRRGAQPLAPWALAASLVLALGVAWHLQPPPAPDTAPGATATTTPARLIDREAELMTREYRAALREMQAAGPVATASSDPARPALRELDRSARDIRAAIRRDPGATFLLDRLQRTYTLRLELTQRSLGQAMGLG